MTHILTAGERQIDLSSPVCMGIINTTPDSFSDGAQLQQVGAPSFQIDLDKALRRAEQMVADGAVFLDVGGESTRPGASEVCLAEELDRVIPVVQAIRKNLDVCISIDTSRAEVMAEATKAGVELINDIRALAKSGAMDFVTGSNVGICLMHMQGQPRTMQQNYQYHDVIEDVFCFLQERSNQCIEKGIAKNRLLLDPGFGFGKSVQHNYKLLKNLHRFTELDLPLLIGISRKSMIGAVTGRPAGQRLAGSIAATVRALDGGASIIRTHDVAATMDAIRVNSAFTDA